VWKETAVLVELWSDFVCPWCYIGRSRLKRALQEYERADEVEIEWRSFLLDPTHRKGVRMGVHEMLTEKTGAPLEQVRQMTDRVRALAAEEGLTYDVERAVVVNTGDAHRLHHLSKAHGLAGELYDRLARAHFAEGEAIDDHDTLVRLAAEVGVPEEESRRVLTSDEYARDVKQDIRQARLYGASGVPFFVLDRTYGLSGAQPVEVILSALRTAHEGAPAST
jgi:predicted DsbA family dithiol-disulfide isomerase